LRLTKHPRQNRIILGLAKNHTRIHYGIQIENRQARLKTLRELIVDIEVIGVGVTQAEAVGILLIPGTATGWTRAADRIFAGRAVIVPLAEETLAIGRLPVAVKRGGVLIVRFHLVGASDLPAPRHVVQFLREVSAGKRVQRDRSANPEVLGEENVAFGGSPEGAPFVEGGPA
jgi:hypothetical protein